MRLIAYIPGGVGSRGDVLRINAEVVRPSGVVVFTDNAHGCNGELLNVDEVHCVGYGGVPRRCLGCSALRRWVTWWLMGGCPRKSIC
ncbi:hypothetical protein [Vulcanisaeta distributa]|uniref:hypothetical protein n=1 Tax=Vulcanisaeta distributa TaxID=164451 RepID=UPI001FB3E44D|nr:hypothetical protein [Vulcanisaeta distributa]